MLFSFRELSAYIGDHGLRIGAVPASAMLKYEFSSTEMLKWKEPGMDAFMHCYALAFKSAYSAQFMSEGRALLQNSI